MAQDVQDDQPGVVGGGQPAQLAAAGNDDQAGRAGRQQRPDLLLITGVVQHDQHPLAGQQAAIAGGALVFAGRDIVAGHTQGAQEPGQRFGRGHRPVRVISAQVHIQLPVTEPVGDLVRPVQRQRGLAHPRGPADRGDHRRTRALRAGLVQNAGQCGQLGSTAGETGNRRGHLPWHRRQEIGGARRR
jgi:hypothetical protein